MPDVDSGGGEGKVPYEKKASAPMFSRCSHNGKSGWRHSGNTTHCFTGPNGKSQCVKHAISTHGAKKFSTMMNNTNKNDNQEIFNQDTVASILYDKDSTYDEIVAVADFFEGSFVEKLALAEYIKKKERDKVPDEDFGDPKERKFPIRNQQDVHDAASLVGKAGNPNAVRKKIIEIAKRKGFSIPKAWE